MDRVPFLFIPPNYDPQTYMVLNRMTKYIKALEEALIRAGIVDMREVEKIATRNESLEAVSSLEERIGRTEQAIRDIFDPQQRANEQAKWEVSDEKAALQQALIEHRGRLLDAIDD